MRGGADGKSSAAHAHAPTQSGHRADVPRPDVLLITHPHGDHFVPALVVQATTAYALRGPCTPVLPSGRPADKGARMDSGVVTPR